MKKIALLVVSILVILSFSAVFATEDEQLLISPAPEEAVTDEVTEVEEIEENDAETLVDVATEEDISGEDIVMDEETDAIASDDENVLVDTATEENNTEVEDVAETTSTKSSSNGSIVGAIIAVVIVIAVVAIAAILRKD